MVFGCRGDGGFNGCCLGASIGDGGFTLVGSSGRRGVIGFNVATLQQPVCEKVRPARPGADASAKKFALLGPVRTRARKSSPCTRKMAQNRRFVARWASFFAITPLEGSRRAKFFAGLHKRPRAGRI